jgi:hypothetical protein
MAIDLSKILNYISPEPTYMGKLENAGLITSDDLDKARNRSLVRGLLTTGLGYLAQPKNQRYGSAAPYLGKAGLMGLQAMDSTYDDYLKGFEMSNKIEAMQREKEGRTKTQEYIQSMINSGDPRWKDLDKLGPEAQKMAVDEALKERFKSATPKAPTQRKRENPVDEDGDGKPDYLETIYEEWDAQEGQFKEVSRSPKDIGEEHVPLTEGAIDMAASGYVLDGTLPPLGRGKSARDDRAKILNKAEVLVKESGGDPLEARLQARLNIQEFKAREISLKNFSTGVEGRKVRSLNTAMAHLESMKEWSNALKNGDVRKANYLANTLSTEFGDPKVTDFNFAKQIVADEVLVSVVQAGGSMQERQELAESFNMANSPEQLLGVINAAHELMAGQLQSLDLQYKSSVGDDLYERNPFINKLSPVTQELYNKMKIGSGQTKQISKADQEALDWYNSSEDSVTKREIGKKLKAKGLL